MRQYLIQRGVQSVFLVLLITGGPSILMNPDLSAAQREQFRRNLGLDQPVAIQ